MSYRVSHEHCIFSFSKDNRPVLFVKDGDEVELETSDCFFNQIRTNDDRLEAMDWDKINPATGPIYVEGAQKGDVLEVEIKKIEIAEKGVIATGKDLGVLGDLMDGLYSRVVDIREGKAVLAPHISIPVKPMIGVIGVAPEEGSINCGTPGPHGGNMDTRLIGESARVYLPVFAEGALFALGDLHAVMGDGEVGVSGVEVAGAVTVKFRVLRGWELNNPLVRTKDVTATIASHESLDRAVSMAVHDMADIFKRFTALPIEEISMLFSITGNVEVSQVVDPLKTARFSLPNWVLGAYGISF